MIPIAKLCSNYLGRKKALYFYCISPETIGFQCNRQGNRNRHITGTKTAIQAQRCSLGMINLWRKNELIDDEKERNFAAALNIGTSLPKRTLSNLHRCSMMVFFVCLLEQHGTDPITSTFDTKRLCNRWRQSVFL